MQISYGTITTVDADIESGEIHKSMPCSISGGVQRNTIAILLLLTCSALAFIILDAGLKMAQKIRILFEDCNAFTRPLRRYHAISFEVCFWAMIPGRDVVGPPLSMSGNSVPNANSDINDIMESQRPTEIRVRI